MSTWNKWSGEKASQAVTISNSSLIIKIDLYGQTVNCRFLSRLSRYWSSRSSIKFTIFKLHFLTEKKKGRSQRRKSSQKIKTKSASKSMIRFSPFPLSYRRPTKSPQAYNDLAGSSIHHYWSILEKESEEKVSQAVTISKSSFIIKIDLYDKMVSCCAVFGHHHDDKYACTHELLLRFD